MSSSQLLSSQGELTKSKLPQLSKLVSTLAPLVPHHSMPISASFHPQNTTNVINLSHQSGPTSNASSPSVEGECSHPSPPTYINMCPMSYPETPSSEIQPTNASPTNNHPSTEDEYALSDITPTFFAPQPNQYKLTSFSQSFNVVPQQPSPKWTPPTTPPTNGELLHPEQCASTASSSPVETKVFGKETFSEKFDDRCRYVVNGTYIKQCLKCGTTSSSQWYLDATGYQLCGHCKSSLDYVRNASQNCNKPQKRVPSSKRTNLVCSNCGTVETTLWRRNEEGKSVCNACGLYRKLHKKDRPLSMRKEKIQKRKRKPKAKEINEQDQPAKKRIKSENVADNSSHENSSSYTSPCSAASQQSDYHQQMAQANVDYHQQMTQANNDYHQQMALPNNDHYELIPHPAMLDANSNYCNERLPPVPYQEGYLSSFPSTFPVGSNLCAQSFSSLFNMMPNSYPDFPMVQQTNFGLSSMLQMQEAQVALSS